MKGIALSSGLCLALVFLCGAAIAQDSATTSTDTSFENVSREAGELLESLKSYGAAQRDEALTASEALLKKVDAQIDSLADEMSRNWDEMDAAARRESQATLKTLREQRVRLAEWYGGMKHSSEGAWDEMKAGFSGAWDSLSDAWDEAAGEFRKSE